MLADATSTADYAPATSGLSATQDFFTSLSTSSFVNLWNSGDFGTWDTTFLQYPGSIVCKGVILGGNLESIAFIS
jgi:hypothetical protein